MKGYKISEDLINIREGMVLAEPVFGKGEDGKFIMLAKSLTELTAALIDKFNKHNIKSIPILSDKPRKRNLLMADPWWGEKTEPKPIRQVLDEKLQEEAISTIEQLFSIAEGNSPVTAHQVVKGLGEIVDQLVETVTTEGVGVIHISQLKSYDEYTYHHSLSVALISIAIGRILKLTRWDLKRLGRCAIMHDIGKILVPIEITNKPGRLTPEEFDIMKAHSLRGGEYLMKEGIGNREMWETISAHHEKFDGSGYPR
ncbi:MAG: HD domain-containing protein, partial [Defluviitaleaceae bacterium]|nr:HD domain-containing protein [Defluviitaleaceae bacterium]